MIIPLGWILVLIVPLLYYMTHSSMTNHFTFGYIIGIISMLSIITFQYAVFWGEYSHCRNIYPSDLESELYKLSHKLGIDCHNQQAMIAVCTFSSCLFVLHIIQIFFIILYNRDILNTENISSAETSELPEEFHLESHMIVQHSLEKQIPHSSSLFNLISDNSPRSSVHFANSTDL